MPAPEDLLPREELEGVGERLAGKGSARQKPALLSGSGKARTRAAQAASPSKPAPRPAVKANVRFHRHTPPMPPVDPEREAALLVLKKIGPEVQANAAGLLAAVGHSEPYGAVDAFAKLGVGLEASGPGERTALMEAATQGDIGWLDCLGAHCVELNRTDAQGHSALHLAVRARSAAAVRWLIDHGAAVEGNCCGDASSLLAHASESGDAEIAGPVLKAIELGGALQWSTLTRAALFKAVQERNKPFTQLLLHVHADPPTLEGSRHPLLAYAIVWGDAEVLRFLLDCGADPNTRLGGPAEKSFMGLVSGETVRYYLEKDRDLTALMLASALGRLDCVEALLEYRASRGKISGRYKMAAISFAAQTRRTDVMQLLLGKSPRPEDQRVKINISLSRQRVVLWKDGRVAYSSSVSTGKPGYSTPSGNYVVTDKQRSRFSTIYKVEMPYFMRLSCSEFGMHAGVVPPYPASHGCIRLPYDAAVRFYREVEPGTLVTISY